MLQAKGAQRKQRNNYHMTLKELAILLNYLQEHYDPMWHTAVLIQYSMGLRASEMLAIQIQDFSPDFKTLKYRQAKTDKVCSDPVPQPCRKAIVAYIYKNRYRLKDGHLFPCYTGKGKFITTTCYGTYWSKWRRGLGRKYPGFLDKYEFNNQTRYRISSHSLRRLHRTTLVRQFPDKIYEVMVACNYADFGSFKRYIDEFQMYEQRDHILSFMDDAVGLVSMFAHGQQQLSAY